MPHYLTPRGRSRLYSRIVDSRIKLGEITEEVTPKSTDGGTPKSRKSPPLTPKSRAQSIQHSSLYCYAIEVIEIAAAATFIVGSICFLPQYSKNVEAFIGGCDLFIAGSLGYVIVCGMTLLETWQLNGAWNFEVWENTFYVVGSVVFAIGAVLFFPERDHCEHIMTGLGEVDVGKTCSSALQESKKSIKGWWGTWLFIAGSLIFVIATFLNALNQRKFYEWQHTAVCFITLFYMLGSVLFSMGSLAFLPDPHCGPELVIIGAWLFIAGSIMFMVASLLSLLRTSYMLNQPEEEDDDESPIVKIVSSHL
jgi:hypothetical protein